MRPHRLNDGFDFIRGQPVCLPHPAEGYFLLIQHGGKRSSNAEFGQYVKTGCADFCEALRKNAACKKRPPPRGLA